MTSEHPDATDSMDATEHNSGDESTTDGWVSTAEAAAALGVHVRTIERRLRSGKLQGRHHHGRPQVWIGDGPPAVARRIAGMPGNGDMPGDTATCPADDAAMPGDVTDCRALTVPEHAAALSATAALADRAIGAAEDGARRVRRSALVAWSTVAVLVVACAVAVWAITDAAGRLRQAQDQAAEASRTATDRLTDMSGRLADVTERAQQAESRAVASATEARQSQERAVGLEQQLTEAQAAVEISMAKQQAAERERDAVRQLLNTRQVAAVEADDDVPGGGVAGQQ